MTPFLVTLGENHREYDYFAVGDGFCRRAKGGDEFSMLNVQFSILNKEDTEDIEDDAVSSIRP